MFLNILLPGTQSPSLACAFSVLALLQVIVISVSGQTDMAKHAASVQGQSQNNVTLSKKKKATTASKQHKEGEKKGKSAFIYMTAAPMEKKC